MIFAEWHEVHRIGTHSRTAALASRFGADIAPGLDEAGTVRAPPSSIVITSELNLNLVPV